MNTFRPAGVTLRMKPGMTVSRSSYSFSFFVAASTVVLVSFIFGILRSVCAGTRSHIGATRKPGCFEFPDTQVCIRDRKNYSVQPLIVLSRLFALVIAALVFGSVTADLYVQKLLPDEHKSDTSRGLLQQLTGIVSLLLALILGTVTGASLSSFWTQKSELEAFSAQMLLLDQSLAQYGPDTKPDRPEGLTGSSLSANLGRWSVPPSRGFHTQAGSRADRPSRLAGRPPCSGQWTSQSVR